MIKRLALVASLVLAAAVALPAQAATPAWVPTFALPDQGYDRLSGFADGTVYLSHTEAVASNRLYRSTDAGMTWSELATPPEWGFNFLTAARFSTPKLGFSAHGKDRLYRTQDAAESWQPTAPLPGLPGGSTFTNGFAVVDGSPTVVVAGSRNPKPKDGCNPSFGVVWSSTNGGRSWRTANLGPDYTPLYVTMFDQKRGALLANDLTNRKDRCLLAPDLGMAVFVTDDGAKTWKRSTHCLKACGSVAMPDAKTVVVGHNDGSLIRTVDFGRSWRVGQRLSTRPRGADVAAEVQWVQGIDFADSKIGYASTKGGGTWRTTDAGLTWTLEASHDSAHQNFVNGDVTALDRERAVIAGPAVVSTRVLTPG